MKLYETTHYEVRTLSEADSEKLFELTNDPVVYKYVPYAYTVNIEDARKNVETYSLGDCKRDFYLGIFDHTGEMVGLIISVQIYPKALDTSIITKYSWRKRGVMKEALAGFKDYLRINNSRISFIDLVIKKSNYPSRSLALSLNAEKIEDSFRTDEDCFRVNIYA